MNYSIIKSPTFNKSLGEYYLLDNNSNIFETVVNWVYCDTLPLVLTKLELTTDY